MSAHDDVDLGHTVAGWTGTAVALVGFTVTGLGTIAVSAAMVVSGILVIALSAVVTWILHLAGWGKPSGPRLADQWDWRVKDLGARQGHPDCLGCRMAGRRTRVVVMPGTQVPASPAAGTPRPAHVLGAEAPVE
ncbi:HGxxPAAW family protein [Streptomyces antibioticus]|uniref:HGxxPAAW family protein n=1 Tax=Streptomyces antibioticus TaxID=1890 RepID=UPI00368FC58A